MAHWSDVDIEGQQTPDAPQIPDDSVAAEDVVEGAAAEYMDEDEFLADDELMEVSGPDEQPTGDAAVSAALSRVGTTAANAAVGASKSIAGGFSAMRQVRQASKLSATARAELRDIERGLEEDRSMLAHRENVEHNYDEIVSVQTTAIQNAQAEIDQTSASLEEQRTTRARLEEELRQMREQHEQKLRPYRNVMDSSRGRSDDAAKALANKRRAVKNAEAAVSNATKRRDQRISAANRAVDNAQERLSAVQREYETLSADPDPSPSAIEKIQNELASERANLETKRAEVPQVSEEAQASVNQAQQNLWNAQRELSEAEKVADAAKQEATAHKDEYDGMFKEAQAKERAHEDAIKACDTRVKDLQRTMENTKVRLDEAQAILDEANEIHAHPETTEGLRQRIADEEADLEDAQYELEELTANERDLRRATRGARIVFIVVTVLVVALIAFLVWFFLLRK